jgi:hypothetical protein
VLPSRKNSTRFEIGTRSSNSYSHMPSTAEMLPKSSPTLTSPILPKLNAHTAINVAWKSASNYHSHSWSPSFGQCCCGAQEVVSACCIPLASPFVHSHQESIVCMCLHAMAFSARCKHRRGHDFKQREAPCASSPSQNRPPLPPEPL